MNTVHLSSPRESIQTILSLFITGESFRADGGDLPFFAVSDIKRRLLLQNANRSDDVVSVDHSMAMVELIDGYLLGVFSRKVVENFAG